MDDPIVRRVQAIVAGVAGPRAPVDATADTPLGEDGFWLDSIATLELIVACEEEFGVVFDGHSELTDAALRTVRSLAELIRSKTT